MKTSTKRLINAAICAVVAITLCVLVFTEWGKNGVETASLIGGAVFYTLLVALIGSVIDETIVEHNQYN